MGLREYRRKRDFKQTPEPSGRRRRTPSADAFVIQKHDASRLHYDLRLQLDGTLKSWAVPKGPTLDPGEKRLAVHVEDHPLDYASFEGTIPEGEYGGGTVMVWDRGRWIPHGDPFEMYRKGRLSFDLEGEKLHGGFSLVRMGGAAGEGGKNWLLIKKQDEAARPAARGEVVEREPDSVVTGRTLEQIAGSRGAVWKSNRKPARPRRRGRTKAPRVRAGTGGALSPAAIPGARAGPLPERPRFQLATLVTDAPEGDAWLHEIKFDGYRAFCRLAEGAARFITRGGHDWTSHFSALAAAAARLPARAALLDGEVVSLDERGVSDFQRLQNSLKVGGGAGPAYMAFDLLHLDGVDLTGAALEARKEALRSLLAPPADGDAGGPIRFSDHVVGDGPEMSRQACRMALEGIVSKRRDRPYRPGRGADWLKVKCLQRQEMAIGGWTTPAGSRTGFGALLMGYHDESGRLVYAGKVGTGFTEASLRDLSRRLEELSAEDSPFAVSPPRPIARAARWVRPELVAEVEFTSWTRDGRLRHPTFRGLREDRPAREVTRERTVAVEQVAGAALEERRAAGPRRSGESPTRVGGARITHPDKVLFPEQGITKAELAAYYALAADRMLPYMGERPLMLVRCPEGHHKECFYQKHAGQSIPTGVRRIPIREGSKTGYHMMVDSAEGVIGLVQMGALEIHIWGTRAAAVERPDLMVLDLDPDTDLPWEEVVRAACETRDRLANLGLRSFVKATGGKGLHVVTPLVPGPSWDELKEFSHAIARAMVADAPDRYTSVMSKARRKGKIYVDYLRNGRGATFIAPYSTRRRPGAPVSAPLTWKELDDGVRSDGFPVRVMVERLRSLRRDPWSGFEGARRRITAAMRRGVE